jgi:hypothetical protein
MTDTPYVLVPREPTPEMIASGRQVRQEGYSEIAIYDAMLAAAPEASPLLPKPSEASASYAAPPVEGRWLLLAVGDVIAEGDESWMGCSWDPVCAEDIGTLFVPGDDPIRRRLPSVPADQTAQQQTVCTDPEQAPASCEDEASGEVAVASLRQGVEADARIDDRIAYLTGQRDALAKRADYWEGRATADSVWRNRKIIGHIETSLLDLIEEGDTVDEEDGAAAVRIRTEYVFGRIFKQPQPNSVPIIADRSLIYLPTLFPPGEVTCSARNCQYPTCGQACGHMERSE